MPNKDFYDRLEAEKMAFLIQTWKESRLEVHSGGFPCSKHAVNIEVPMFQSCLLGVLESTVSTLGDGYVKIPIYDEGATATMAVNNVKLLTQNAEIGYQRLGLRFRSHYKDIKCVAFGGSSSQNLALIRHTNREPWRYDPNPDLTGTRGILSAIGLAKHVEDVFDGWKITPIKSVSPVSQEA